VNGCDRFVAAYAEEYRALSVDVVELD